MEEKLINLLSTAGWDLFKDGTHSKRAIAKHLIANGVTIPVRCKDCKHREYIWGEWCCCKYDDSTVDDNHFCSYGEER